MTTTLSFKCFVEQNLGRQGLAFIYGILEFVMVVLLLLDGILGFFSAEFAKFFELEVPCFVCARIDHTCFASYCNGSVCEAHKKDISSLAYCHAHNMLSDIRNMCEECLLSFSTHTDSGDCDRYRSLLGVMHKDIDYSDPKTAARFWSRDFEQGGSAIHRCSCCGELLNRPKYTANASMKAAVAPPPSPSHTPRPCCRTTTTDQELPHIPYTELSFISNNDSELPDNEDHDVLNGGGESSKSATMLLLPESGELLEDDCKTPSFIKGNKFFGIPLSDSTQASPRWFNQKSRKMSMEFLSDLADTNALNEGDGEILYGLKKQVRLDRRSLMALYMELDEERSASAVAANNAMAMITRLQAEKAAVRMEALQHQRMMEEHAEYYREELQVMKDMLLKREEEVKVLESELEVYREKFGSISKVGSEICEVDANEDYQERRSQCISPFSERMSDIGNQLDETETDNDHAVLPDHSGEYTNENMVDSSLEIENERSHLLNLLSNFEKKCNASSDEGFLPVKVEEEEEEEEEDQQDWAGNDKKVILTREMSDIRERLRAIEAESGFIKHATMTLQRGDEGIKLLTEIADNLRKLRAL